MLFANELRSCAVELHKLAYTTPPGCEGPFLELSQRLNALARQESQQVALAQ